MTFLHDTRRRVRRTLWSLLAAALALCQAPAFAAEFSITPIRIELKPGVMSETVTVINHADKPLRVTVKLAAWTQDEQGKDVYTDSADLVYFPRQLDLPPDSKRLVRVGLKTPAGSTERAYRLFVEEIPEVAAITQPQVNFTFRFGVPIFLPPVQPRAQFEVLEPKLSAGQLSIGVRNAGNQHVRLTKLTISDGGSYQQELAGWYSLAGTQRSYAANLPADVCRRVRKLDITVEGNGLRVDRQLHVDPGSCS
ncbi:fimbria/pilus periplasmic chaperone [Ramlibacter tataouinensis]|uniref:fimbrial biogenesis chaperone n=1 Tax=Ramlibacter tataouinensis TaxID=94132 RepID=UPI0022F3C589|nr:fimbria/pilus periplasmic chaperone [Ramlibacter tataouinensis]WBY03762.1 fimbria/pilus periplasmic chaperone [Ramlibacter tataouinensis]